MTREEFLSLKEELTNVVVEYEVLKRKSSFLNNSYILQFKEELEKQRYLLYENEYLSKAIAKQGEKENLEDIKKYLEEAKKEFEVQIQTFHQQVHQAEEMEKRCSHYHAKDIENLDREFIEYCKLYHPALKAHSTENELNLYNVLVTVYRLGNIAGFKALMSENRDVFTSQMVTEEEYDRIAKYYLQSLQNLSGLLNNLKNSFPLNKEQIFIDDEAYTKEYMYLREKNYAAREMNASLHKDFLLNFSFDFEL